MRAFCLLILFSTSALTASAQKSATFQANVSANIVTPVPTADSVIVQQISAPAAYKYVDQMPAFPGDLRAFIGKNLVYPEAALKAGIKGEVVIQFLVKTDGSLSNISIIKKADPLLEKEALRLMSLMPKWTPAKNKGQVVESMYLLPLTFNPE